MRGAGAAAAGVEREGEPACCCRRNDSARVGSPGDKVTTSRDAANPGCTTRTSYRASGNPVIVNGVRPRHSPLTVTPAPVGVERTARLPLVAGAALAAGGLTVRELEGAGAAAAGFAVDGVDGAASRAAVEFGAAAGGVAPDVGAAAGGVTACSLNSRPADASGLAGDAVLAAGGGGEPPQMA